MTTLSLSPYELALRLGLAIGLALFLGLTFEEIYKSEGRSVPGGIRSFPMLAMAGAMLTLIEPAYAVAFIAGLPVLALWLYAFARSTPRSTQNASIMIPASNLLAYIIGPIALTQPHWVAVAVTVAAVLLLTARDRLHRLIGVVPREELLTAGKFLILIGIVLPLVPRQQVATLTPLTPYGVWLAVVAVCSLSYVSYLLQRYLPRRDVALLPAILGGTYSSTATTVVLSKRLHESGQPRPDISAGIVVATAVMYLRIGIVVAIFNSRLALLLAPGLISLAVIGGALAAYEWSRQTKRARGSHLALAPGNPLQIQAAVVFALLLVVVSIVTVWVRTTFGTTGILELSAVVGVTDVDPFVLNIAQGGITGVEPAVLCAAVLIAASSNNVAKAAYAAAFGGRTAAHRPAMLLLLLALLGGVVAAIYATAI